MTDLRRTVAVVSQGKFDADPRHSYWSSSFRSLGCDVVEVEILDEGCPARLRASMSVRSDRWTVTVNRFATVADASHPPILTSRGRYLASTDRVVAEAVSLLSPALTDAAMVVAIDLLVARNVVVRCGSTMVLYDAHEVFVESYDMLDAVPLSGVERLYWKQAEREVVQTAFAAVTVSPGIAEFMRDYTGVLPSVIPNYLPLGVGRERKRTNSGKEPVRFVFVGRADPFRGLEHLVSSWDVDPSQATLDLYITDSPRKSRLRSLSNEVARRHTGPVFREPVDPADIPTMLEDYDVGVVPYEYPPPYSEASPNKFGEYVAAGLSVISNGDGFVSRQVLAHSIGTVFDWTTPGTFAASVEEMVGSVVSGRFRGRSATVFRESMNWEVASGSLMEEITQTLRSVSPKPPCSPPKCLQVDARLSSVVLSVVLNPVFGLIRRSSRVRLLASLFHRLVNVGRK